MKKTQLSKAIALALTGAATAFAGISTAQAGSTGYNTFNHDRAEVNNLYYLEQTASPIQPKIGTDGWLITQAQTGPAITGSGAGDSYGNGINAGNLDFFGGAGANVVQWVGLNPYSDFGYAPSYSGVPSGKSYHTLNWVAEIGANDSAVISKDASNTAFGGTTLADGTTFNYADIDTAKGAWHDGVSTGWTHDTDLGLFRSTVDQEVTINIASLIGSEVDETPVYGITIFDGMTPGQFGSYTHHATWHGVSNALALGVAGSGAEALGTDISATTSANYSMASAILVLDDILNNNATFTAQAGHIYTFMLGGFQGGAWDSTRNNYQLTISSAAPVPVPGAAWLFGGAIASLIGANRRKRVVPA